MAAPGRFDVFISHSAKDKEAVNLIVARLRRRGLTVWYDAEGVGVGDVIPMEIDNGLMASDRLAIFLIRRRPDVALGVREKSLYSAHATQTIARTALFQFSSNLVIFPLAFNISMF